MSQPAATQALTDLEQLLDTALFERHARGMRSTAAGQLLVPVARQMLLALRASTESLSAMQQGQGLLRIGFIPAAASALARVTVGDFCQRHSGVRLEITEAAGDQLLQALAAGSLDLVLGRRPVQLPAGLDYLPLLADEAVVLAGLGHPLVQQAKLAMDDLAAFPWMLAPAGMKAREVFDEWAARRNPPPRIHPISTASLAFLVEILSDDQTLALVPRSLGHALCHWGLAKALHVTDLASLEGIGFMGTADSFRLPTVQALLDVMAEAGARA